MRFYFTARLIMMSGSGARFCFRAEAFVAEKVPRTLRGGRGHDLV